MFMNFLCSICGLSFLAPWISTDPSGASSCMFCKYYHPTKDTRYSLLQDVENRFMMSGFISRPEFYRIHIGFMNAWADHYSMPPATAMELSYEQQLLKVADWTRDFWH